MRNHIHILFLSWCGFFSALFIGAGLVLISEFIPPHSPSSSAAEIVAIYQSSPNAIRSGLILSMFGMGLLIPVIAAVSMNMARAEGQFPYLAVTQAMTGSVAIVLATIPFLCWLVAAFRLNRNPELIMLLNDLGWITFTTPAAPIMLQLLTICVCGLQDKREKPFMPRWGCFLGIWIVVGLFPVTLIPFFTDGPFAWNGIIAFWLPIVLALVWGLALIVGSVYSRRKYGQKKAAALSAENVREETV